MGWRSVVITQPAYLSLGVNALQIKQSEQQAQVPLEDISVLVLDNPQITITGQLLTTCAKEQIVVITVNESHLPNGLYLPFLPHSRALKVMRAQMDMGVALKKQLQKTLIQQKIKNHAALLHHHNQQEVSRRLYKMADAVRSGDPDNMEAIAAQTFFPALFGADFNRQQDRFYNSALNYGYAIIRASIARTLVSYGFLPAFGFFHKSEQNAFNLADDLIEPYRAFVDYWVLKHFSEECDVDLTRQQKATLISLLHEDIVLSAHKNSGACTLLAAIEASVISLSQITAGKSKDSLNLPCLQSTLNRQLSEDIPDE